jgi:acyl-CoA synthetase (AMP-forming)/AMP-acid ligase II
VTLGGEIADSTVLAALARTFPEARVTHIYASTEAGVGFSVKDGKAGFPARYLQEPPGAVELRLDEEGRLWLRPSVRGQFFVGRETMETSDGWIDSGDLVKREGDRCYFLGRANGAINVGGDKVFPEEVEQVILELAEVALARVTGRPNPIVGSLVQAVVVPREAEADAPALSRLVQQHCARRLERFKVPAVVTVASGLDMGEAGKLARRGAFGPGKAGQ